MGKTSQKKPPSPLLGVMGSEVTVEWSAVCLLLENFLVVCVKCNSGHIEMNLNIYLIQFLNLFDAQCKQDLCGNDLAFAFV